MPNLTINKGDNLQMIDFVDVPLDYKNRREDDRRAWRKAILHSLWAGPVVYGIIFMGFI